MSYEAPQSPRTRKLSTSLSFSQQDRRSALEKQLKLVDSNIAALERFISNPTSRTSTSQAFTSPPPQFTPASTPYQAPFTTPTPALSVTSSTDQDPDGPRGRRQKRPSKLLYDPEGGSNPEPHFYAGCRALVKTIRSKRDSVYFHEPVNTSLVTDYLNVVKQPMDLFTISEKLANRQYSCFEEFDMDMHLIFSNCLMYNKRDTPYSEAAIRLQQVYEAEMRRLRDKGRLDHTPRPRPVSAPRSASRVTQGNKRTKAAAADDVTILKQQVMALQNQLQGIHSTQMDQTVWDVSNPAAKRRKQSTSKARPKKKVPGQAVLPAGLQVGGSDSESDHDVPMSYDEKVTLSENINKLPPQKLLRIVEIIRKHMPNLSRNSADPDEIEIDIDLLDNPTLRHLESYVGTCLEVPGSAKKKKSRKRPPAQSAPPAQPTSFDAGPGVGMGMGMGTMPEDSSSSDSDGPPALPGTLGAPM